MLYYDRLIGSRTRAFFVNIDLLPFRLSQFPVTGFSVRYTYVLFSHTTIQNHTNGDECVCWSITRLGEGRRSKCRQGGIPTAAFTNDGRNVDAAYRRMTKTQNADHSSYDSPSPCISRSCDND